MQKPSGLMGTLHLVTAELVTWTFVSKAEPARIPGYWYGKNGSPSMPTPIPSEPSISFTEVGSTDRSPTQTT
ncbi:hypothetical protein JVU11DRAFT_2407 [Chiua virens]|nr:hypothetical protein JVU11DRAFT_2407 [Chiua virens]